MKIIVAHPQQQHSYRLATALSMDNTLLRYCTTVYYRPHTLTALVAKLLPPYWKKKAIGRHCEQLQDDQVVQFCEAGGLAVLFCHNIPFASRWYWRMKRRVEDAFARKVAELARMQRADAVIGYDGCSASLFEEVKRRSPNTVCICDMSAANALYLKTVYEKDSELQPEYASTLKIWKRFWDPIDIARTERELAAADCFLCGSEFTKRSLVWSGIDEESCEICHYGVDVSSFPCKERCNSDDMRPLTFVYLGEVSEHKGIAYLIDAFSGISEEQARLLCIGAIHIPSYIVDALPGNVEFLGRIQHDEVSSCLLSADVMVFPSLGDGFSLSMLEALASGLPVICSENTGAADCIVDGKNGFIVPVQDSNALREKMCWFISHREEIPRMSAEARNRVLDYTWDAYNERVATAVRQMVESRSNG